MDRKESVEVIVYECIAGNGFLVKLRGNEFSQEQFNRLFQALVYYRDFIKNHEFMERRVAYCI